MPRESLRIEGVQSPIIPVIAELIQQNPGTISLGQGVVSYGPPPEAIEEIQVFLRDANNHKYKPVVGIPALISSIGEKLKRENRLTELDPEMVVVTAGGNLAFMNAVLAIADPDDEIILPTPYYFNHEMAVTMASGKPVLVETDSNYQLQVDRLERAITPRTKAILTVSPNNPTGAIYPEADLRRVNALCRERGIYHIHDEAYEYFTYGGARHFSPGSIPGSGPHTISLFSLSKAYGFASWRIGYMVIPKMLLGAIKKIQDTLLICAPVISQYAAVGAMRAGFSFCRPRIAAIDVVREIVLHELKAIRDICEVPPALGAFYFLLRIRTNMPSQVLAERLIREHRVAVIPGSAFAAKDGCYLRVAYGALEAETARAGVGRLVVGLRALVGTGE